jgi:arsenate reductase-like glutaredoxin family protein
MGEALSQDDLNALFGDLSLETKETPAQKIDKTDKSITQDDLNALFGELSLGIKEPPVQETKSVESAGGSENMTQDQIDALLEELLNG